MRYLALLGILAVGCGGGADLAGPSMDAPRAIVVNVVVDPGADTPALAGALAIVETHFAGRLRFVRDGSGSRTIRVTIDAARMAEPSAYYGYNVHLFAVPFACPCVAEGEIVLRSAEAAVERKLFLHEIGHLFGLGHHGRRGMMGWSESDAESYSDEEWQRLEAALAADSDVAGGNLAAW